MTDQTLKELNKEKHKLNIKIEIEAEEFDKLYKRSEELKIENENLKKQEKEIDKEYLNYLTNLDDKVEKQMTENPNQIDEDLVSNPKLLKLKEEAHEMDCLYNSKIELLKQLKQQEKTIINQNNKIATLISEIIINEKEVGNTDEEIKNLHVEIEKMENKAFGESIEIYSSFKEQHIYLVKNIKQLEDELSETNNLINSVEYDIYNNLKSSSQMNKSICNELVNKKQIEFKYQKICKDVEDLKILISNCEVEIDKLNSNIVNNSEKIEIYENEIQNIYYFIKYCNSFISSVFNIINSRRVQIELVSKFNMNPSTMNKEVFEKLDKMETELLDEYDLVLINFKKDVCINLNLNE